MNKRIVLSILFGLSLTAATPAQAAWYNPFSWFRSAPVQNQPAQGPGLEAPQPQIRAIVPAAQGSWMSRIFSNPLAGFYAWWNKSTIINNQKSAEAEQTIRRLQALAQERATAVLESRQTIDDLQDLSQERARNIYTIDEQHHARIATLNRQIAEADVHIAAMMRRLGELGDRRDADQYNSQAERDAFQEKERTLKAELQKLRQNIEETQQLKQQAESNFKAQQEASNRLAQRQLIERQENSNAIAILQAQLEVFKGQTGALTTQLQNAQLQLAEARKAKVQPASEANNSSSAASLEEVRERFNNPPAENSTATALVSSLTGSFVRLDGSPDAPSLLDAAREEELSRVSEHVPTDPSFILQHVHRGKDYAQKILTGIGVDQIPTDTQEDYLNSIVSINWFFYDNAISKKQTFTEGTFVIEDKDLKFYNFFMNYIKKFNKDIKGDVTDPLAHYSYNPYGYSRDASHFVHVKKKHRPYGIDMRRGNSGQLPLLPAYKKHMLFGIVDAENHTIYVKPENNGIYYADGLIAHIGEFTIAQARKPNFIATTVRNALAYFGYAIGTDEGELNRKERIPPAFLKQFAEAVKSDEALTEKQAELIKKAKQDGIQTLENTDVARSESPQIKELVQQYRQEYNNDISGRYGNEVRINHAALLTHAGVNNN